MLSYVTMPVDTGGVRYIFCVLFQQFIIYGYYIYGLSIFHEYE